MGIRKYTSTQSSEGLRHNLAARNRKETNTHS